MAKAQRGVAAGPPLQQLDITELSEETELWRDRTWRRSVEYAIEGRLAAERFIEDVGFCSALTDVRTAGPSLYIAVCGRRDAHAPRNVQKDPEMSLAWRIKDEVMRAGQVYYAKLSRSRSTFIRRDLISAFASLWVVPKKAEKNRLSEDAQAILKVLRKEWEMASADLRDASGVRDRKRFNKAMDELQRTMKLIPSDVLYEPYFTYIWTLPEARFPEEMSAKLGREEALRNLAAAFLSAASVTLRGELARVTGLSRKDAGIGNQLLVAEGIAERLAVGVYHLRT